MIKAKKLNQAVKKHLLSLGKTLLRVALAIITHAPFGAMSAIHAQQPGENQPQGAPTTLAPAALGKADTPATSSAEGNDKKKDYQAPALGILIPIKAAAKTDLG